MPAVGRAGARGRLTLSQGQAVIFPTMSKPPAPAKYLAIGQLAAQSGVSAKALRLYEARGLLVPDARSDAGYRLYGAPALARLNEIGVLKRAGFTLAEVGKLLERKGSAAALIQTRIVALRGEVQAKAQALAALQRAWHGLDSASNDIAQLLENMKMNEKLDVQLNQADKAEFKRQAEIMARHFTPEDRERLGQRGEELGEARMQQVQHEWPRLIADIRAAMQASTPPTAPEVTEMGYRWYALMQMLTSGDSKFGLRMKTAYEKEPEVMAAQGLDSALFAYIREAMQAAGLKLSA